MSATEPKPPVLHFLNQVEAATLDAMASRIIPGDAGDPGAHEAQAVVFIDRTLSGFLRDQQTPYRLGLRRLDASSRERYGRRFVELEATEQDAVLEGLDRSGDRFFAVVREHVVQGVFG